MVSVGAPRVIAGTGAGTDTGSSISEVGSGMGCVHSPVQPDSGRDGEVKTWLQWYARQMAAGADGLQGLHAADGGRAGQPLGELILMRGIPRHQFQQEIAATPDH